MKLLKNSWSLYVRDLFRKRLEFKSERSIKGDNFFCLRMPEWMQLETTVFSKYGFQHCLILTYI